MDLKAVAAYVYAGGFSLGVREYVPVQAHLEDEKPYGENIINLNRKLFWGDMPVHPFPWPKVKADLLFSNPPCAPFSNCNPNSFKDGWRSDSRLQCWENVVEYGLKHRFPFIAIETVPQAYSKAEDFLAEKMNLFIEKGYQAMIFLHNAMLMGSCQNRPRLLFLASIYDIHLEPYYHKPIDTVDSKLDCVYVAEGDEYQPVPAKRHEELLVYTRPGERFRDAWNRLNPPESRVLNHLGHVRGRPSFGIRRLKGSEQCGTMVGYDLVHPQFNRYLNNAELKAITDFPAEYLFVKSGSAKNYMARGVSSKVGQWLGRTVLNTLSKRKKPIIKGIIHNGLQGWDNHKEYYIAEYLGFPKISLRSKFK